MTHKTMNQHGLESPLFCHHCNNVVHYCVCEDLDDRMRDLTGPGGLVSSRWCKSCDHHFTRCECETPDWWLRNEGQLVRPFNETFIVHGKPIDA